MMRAHDAARTTAPASTDQHGCCETIPRAETLEEFQEYVCKGHPAIYNLPGSDDGDLAYHENLCVMTGGDDPCSGNGVG